jgi:hypothetical protein
MPAGYIVRQTSDMALAIALDRVAVHILNAANGLIRVTALGISFDGISATAEPVLVELCSSSEATAGSGATTSAPVQVRGPTRAVQATGKVDFPNATPPTVLNAWHEWLVHPQSGITIQFPFGREPEQTTTADALCLRVTAPQAVNCRAWMEFEEG